MSKHDSLSMAYHTLRREVPEAEEAASSFGESFKGVRDKSGADQERFLSAAAEDLSVRETWNGGQNVAETRGRAFTLFSFVKRPAPAKEPPKNPLHEVVSHLCLHVDMFQGLDRIGAGMADVQARLRKILSLTDVARDMLETEQGASIDRADPLDTIELLEGKVATGQMSESRLMVAINRLVSRMTLSDDRRLQAQSAFERIGGTARLTHSISEAIVQMQRMAQALLDEFDDEERVTFVAELGREFQPWLAWQMPGHSPNLQLRSVVDQYIRYHTWLRSKGVDWIQREGTDGYRHNVLERKQADMWVLWQTCAREIHANAGRYDAETRELLPQFCGWIGVRDLEG